MGDHHDKHELNKVKLTTGPFLIPEEVGTDIQIGRNNDRLIIILKNPTNKELKASVNLGICRQPNGYPMSAPNPNQFQVFSDIHEKDFSLGTHELDPHTCTRIERDIPGGGFDSIGIGTGERNAVYRVTVEGDFRICKKTCQPICGLLEVSVVAGSIFNPQEPGLEQADPATFFRYKDFVFCEEHKDD
ncbi:hypothetical protein QFZ87_002925 [Bacillus sp. SLBN-46]|uniref:hypothetical protein n=1 Tax=Bacillus sp. SLBN-46 TaxID=3042283 RepID=UPI002861EF38|nr:hypothetical protein [Bacillus sp. SLBN-46]MDR6123328.1 hypothetical protein [Bacillus sp. SLBN-46]